MPHSRRWTFTNLLQKQYGRLYKDKALARGSSRVRPTTCLFLLHKFDHWSGMLFWPIGLQMAR
jgi:hypothetical protein